MRHALVVAAVLVALGGTAETSAACDKRETCTRNASSKEIVVHVRTNGASAHELSFVDGDKASVLTFGTTQNEAYSTVRVALLLRNDSSRGGKLEVRFFVDGGPALEPVTPAATELPAMLLLEPATGAVVAAHSVTRLTLALRRAEATSLASGTLAVRLAGPAPVGPAVLALAAATAAGPLNFAQKDAALQVTRALGPLSGLVDRWESGFLLGESVTIGTRGQTPETAAAIVNSDGGGSAHVMFKRTDDDSSRLTSFEISDRGKYSGNLTIDPDAQKPRSLAVTLHVRDFILWPLLALLAGAAVGAFVIRKHDLRRGRGLVQKAIKDAIDPYLAARARNSARSDAERDSDARYYLNDLLPDDRSASPYYRERSCAAHGLPDVPRLYCRTYTVDSDEALTELINEVKETTSRFDRWLKVERAVEHLKHQFAPLPSGSPMHADADALLVRTRQEPDDDQTATDLVRVLSAEARFVALYRHLRTRFDEQPEQWRKVHTSLDPDHDVEPLAAIDVWKRTEADVEGAERALLVKAELMREPDKIPPDDHPDELFLLFEHVPGDVNLLRAGLPSTVQRELVTSVPPPTADTRSPELIYAQVRRADWFVFWVAAALTAVVYLSQQYKGEYGSLEDYLFAFAAGAVTPAVVNWALLPFSRSYRAATKKAAGTEAPAAS